MPKDLRLNFVRDACGSDSTLLQRVIEQLGSSGHDIDWWERSMDASSIAEDSHEGTPAGTMIGKYRVIRGLGSGGMGEVVLAERADEAFSQQVAIKLVRSGFVSRQMQSRLKVERQILATLDHPNIAKLLDGGTTENGTPYIVMEYIVGEPIDVYCDERRLSIRQRLELFRVVCSTVHYAHRNLIVHRDLKPSNIMVTADGKLKLLDFGIAKVLDSRQVSHTMAVTHADVRLMTPDHASPEQVRGDAVTTASDIYVLGILLYELLTGRKPYALQGTHVLEIGRVICEEPPLPLSYGLTGRLTPQDAELMEQIFARRSTTRSQLRRDLRGDLSSIAMMALRKEPERRYQSAEQFAADIDNLLAQRPVLARPDTWSYRTGKFVSRYRYGVAAACTALVALVGFTVYTIAQNERIARERSRAEQVAGFLVDLFQKADPSHSRGSEIKVREVLDIGSRRIETDLSGQPEIRASLLATMGTVYGALGLYDNSVELLEESLQSRTRLYGPEHPEVADAMERLGSILVKRNEYGRAEPLLIKALEIQKRSAAPDDLRVAAALQELASLRRGQERFAEADQLFKEARGLLGEDAPSAPLLIETLNDHALLLDYMGDHAAAEATYRNAIVAGERWLGSDHPDLADLVHNLADSLSKQGRVDEAAPLFQRSLALYRKLLGTEHPYTVMALANYGRFLHQRGDLKTAEQVLREALRLDEKVRGPDHVFVGYDHGLLGLLLLDLESPAEAADEFRKAMTIYGKSLPPNHLYFASARLGLGRALVEIGRPKDGEVELREAHSMFESSLGPENPSVRIVGASLGYALAAQQRFAEAEPLLQQGYIAALKTRGADEPTTRRIHSWIAGCYEDWGNPDKATQFFEFAQESTKKATVATDR